MEEEVNELHLFAGAGGGILGSQLLGHTCVCAVEVNPFCREVLLQRQRDRMLPLFPIWDDVRSFDGRPWKGLIDGMCGGFPCQDISSAGKGVGLSGSRSGLWSEFVRIIGEVRPKYVFVENSPMLVSRGLEKVLAGLTEMGYNAGWGIVGAFHVGAPHKRERIWILAHTDNAGVYPRELQCCRRSETFSGREEHPLPRFSGHGKNIQWWDTDPAGESKSGLGRVAHGMANRMDRLKAIGNGQVPSVAATAFNILGGNN